MKKRYANSVGPLAPRLELPSHYQSYLRARLADVEDATSPHNAEIAKARALGAVEFAELASALEAERTERLFIMIEDAFTARLQELEAGYSDPS